MGRGSGGIRGSEWVRGYGLGWLWLGLEAMRVWFEAGPRVAYKRVHLQVFDTRPERSYEL